MLPRLLPTALLCLLITGCTQHQVKPENHSGYLSNYQRLEAIDGLRAKRWTSGNLKNYQAIQLAPVKVFPQHNSDSPQHIKLANKIASYLNDGFKKILTDRNRLATNAGKDVLLFKPAITGVSSNTAELMPHQYVLPVAIARTAIQTATHRRPMVVEVFLETKMLNSQDLTLEGEVISKGIDKQSDGDIITQDDVKALLDNWLAIFAQGIDRMFDQP